MPSLFIEQLGELGKKVRVDAWKGEHDWAVLAQEAAELTVLATSLFLQIEKDASNGQAANPEEWNEAAARSWIPTFQEWHTYATAVKTLRIECKAHGYIIEGGESFYHAYNRAKMMAMDFDKIVESSRRFATGEEKGRSLEEVIDELSRQTGN